MYRSKVCKSVLEADYRVNHDAKSCLQPPYTPFVAGCPERAISVTESHGRLRHALNSCTSKSEIPAQTILWSASVRSHRRFLGPLAIDVGRAKHMRLEASLSHIRGAKVALLSLEQCKRLSCSLDVFPQEHPIANMSMSQHAFFIFAPILTLLVLAWEISAFNDTGVPLISGNGTMNTDS